MSAHLRNGCGRPRQAQALLQRLNVFLDDLSDQVRVRSEDSEADDVNEQMYKKEENQDSDLRDSMRNVGFFYFIILSLMLSGGLV